MDLLQVASIRLRFLFSMKLVHSNNHQHLIFSDNGRYVPRTLFIDTDPYTIPPIRRGKYRDLYHPDFLISGKHDLSSIFFDGFYVLEPTLLFQPL